MATDFTYDNKTINSNGGFKPSGKNTPIDVRTRVNTFADIESIPVPYIGMIITVLEDETNSNKMTDYKVLSLKANSLGVANSVVDQVQRYVDYLGASSSGSGEGLTTEQEQQLATAYEHSQSAHVQASDIPSLEGYATETFVTNKIAEANLGTGSDVTIINSDDKSIAKFKNIKVLIEGDSITEVNSKCNRNWHSYLKEWFGWREIENHAVSGTGFMNDGGAKSRLANYSTDVDLILLMGCMNDLEAEVDANNWGTINDNPNSETYTTYSKLKFFFEKLLEKFPTTSIAVITSAPRHHWNDVDTGYGLRYGIGTNAEKLNNILIDVCKNYAIPVLDLYHNSLLRPWIDSNNELYFKAEGAEKGDRVHPNDAGQKTMAYQIYEFIKNLPFNKPIYITAESISFEQGEYNIVNGNTKKLNVAFTPSNATNKNLSFISSDNSVATISDDGLVTSLKLGTTTITATSVDGVSCSTVVNVINSAVTEDITTDGLALWLDGNSGSNSDTTIIDKSGNEKNFSLTGFNFDGTTNGWCGNYLLLNKNDAYLLNDDVSLSSSAYTFEFKYEPLASDAYQFLIEFNENTKIGLENISDSNYFGIKILGTSVTLDFVYLDSPIHFFFVVNGTSCSIYNGKTKLKDITIVDDISTIGKTIIGGATKSYETELKAKLHCVRFYNKALSEAEIAKNVDYEATITRE